MLFLVTGATGFLGGHLAAALLARGDRVRGLGRNQKACADLARRGVQVVQGDLRDRSLVVSACAGVDVVYHVGALSAPWGKRADFQAINVGGTAHVVDGARQHGIGRLVYVSSPSVVFDGRAHHDLAEDAPAPARLMCTYSRTKKLGEDLVNAAAQSGLATVIIRPKAIFGPGDTTLLPRLLLAARQGRLIQVGDGNNLVDLTYVENVVHALLLAARAENAVGRTYTITNGEHLRLWDVIKTVLRRLGYNANLRSLPYRVAYALAALMELRATVFGGEPLLTRYITAILGRTQTYNIGAAQRDLGYRPLVTVAEGIETTVKALGEW